MREIRTLRATWRGLETWHGLAACRRASPRPYRRGHGQVPNASMDARSMSTTITFRSDGAGLRSHWSPAAWTTLLPASQRSPAVRFDY